ncbi:hypothetical protein HAX54_030821, partial [Datura stramonium]|nr:hypothetical protein [Datura stramonium]
KKLIAIVNNNKNVTEGELHNGVQDQRSHYKDHINAVRTDQDDAYLKNINTHKNLREEHLKRHSMR